DFLRNSVDSLFLFHPVPACVIRAVFLLPDARELDPCVKNPRPPPTAPRQVRFAGHGCVHTKAVVDLRGTFRREVVRNPLPLRAPRRTQQERRQHDVTRPRREHGAIKKRRGAGRSRGPAVFQSESIKSDSASPVDTHLFLVPAPPGSDLVVCWPPL